MVNWHCFFLRQTNQYHFSKFVEKSGNLSGVLVQNQVVEHILTPNCDIHQMVKVQTVQDQDNHSQQFFEHLFK